MPVERVWKIILKPNRSNSLRLARKINYKLWKRKIRSDGTGNWSTTSDNTLKRPQIGLVLVSFIFDDNDEQNYRNNVENLYKLNLKSNHKTKRLLNDSKWKHVSVEITMLRTAMTAQQTWCTHWNAKHQRVRNAQRPKTRTTLNILGLDFSKGAILKMWSKREYTDAHPRTTVTTRTHVGILFFENKFFNGKNLKY